MCILYVCLGTQTSCCEVVYKFRSMWYIFWWIFDFYLLGLDICLWKEICISSLPGILNFLNWHERTTTAKNMGILKYRLTSLISYEICWPLACLEDLIKPNHQGARWTSNVSSMLRVPVLALIIETSAVWPWCRRSFQDVCRGQWIYSCAYLWLISHDLLHGVPLASWTFFLLVSCMEVIIPPSMFHVFRLEAFLCRWELFLMRGNFYMLTFIIYSNG
jgi:hypothetical protein